jgi:mannosylglycerate hydrolase
LTDVSAPRVAYIVSHTHWDREWYRPFHEFRVELTRVVRAALDALERDDDFEHFLLDGQAIVLQDHLEIHPEDGERIRRLVSSGSLALGPWYVLPDEFLVSAEATVRNLLVGQRVARRWGGVQRVGYLPDSFGHIAQLPQILRRAGIDSFVYTRGNGDELETLGHEFLWCAPDGSEVLAIQQCGGYCNAGGLGHEEPWHAHTRREVGARRAVEQVRELFREMSRLSRGDVYLLNNGCDHFPPQRDFGRILAALREAFPRTTFIHGGLEAYVEEVKRAGIARERHSGELIGGKLHPILSGVWSARVYLKQRNDSCQSLLGDYLEPLAAYAHFRHGLDYPAGAIDHAWRLLLRNHPHDSICGCSVDAVHREMETRFDGVEQTARTLLQQRLEAIAPTFARRAQDDAATVLCVANPTPLRRSEVVERLVVLQPCGLDAEDLELVDESGRVVPFRVLDRRYLERFWGIDYRSELFSEDQHEKFQVYLDRFGERIVRGPEDRARSDVYFTIQFRAEDLPALGHANYRLRKRHDGREALPPPGSVEVRGDCIENEQLRVRLHPDGSLDVEDRASGRILRGLNRLEDTEDVGDEYDYSPADRSLTVFPSETGGRVGLLRDGGLRGRLEADFALRLPASIAPDRESRSGDRVDCRTRVRVGLDQGSRLIDVELLFDNLARDHRLRAVFPTDVHADTVVSDGHFYLNRRPIRQPEGADWVQPPPGTYPQQDFSLVEDGRRGLAVLARGLHEVEATHETDGSVTLRLTLLRAVDWLSRDDFDTRRRSNAGPTLYTPGAQCAGARRFRYAIVPFDGNLLGAGIKGLSQRYRTPPLVVQGVEDQSTPGGDSFISLRTGRSCVSAIKKHEERDHLVVRLYNLTAEPVEESLAFGLPVAGAWRTDLLEQRGDRLEVENEGEVPLRLGPHEIATVEIEFLGPRFTSSRSRSRTRPDRRRSPAV